MKRTILMFGNDNFESIIYSEGNMKVKPNKLVAKLNSKYNLLNFSNEKLTIESSTSILKLCTKSNIRIDGCYIALSDLLNKSNSLDEFENKVVGLINYLKENDIPCYIFDKLNKSSKSTIDYEALISFLSKNYSFKLVAHRTIELISNEAGNSKVATNLCM